jgi:single-strand DNA-binding protein
MNVITITGTLGRDMEQRAMPNGDPVGNFSVADSQGREKPTIWWNCQLFGKRVSALAPYLMKGQQVTVVGTVTEREWIDKEGGKRKQIEIRVNDLALQGGKREQSAEPAPAPRAAPAPAPAFAGGFDDDDSSIPF